MPYTDPEKVIDKAVVIREDGTVWDIWLSNFESWELIEIEREPCGSAENINRR